MCIVKVDYQSDRTIFKIEEPRPYGEHDISRKVEVLHSEILTLRTITRDEIQSLPNDPQGCDIQETESYEVPGVGIIVFINDYDCDFSSSLHREGSHTTSEPYFLVEDEENA